MDIGSDDMLFELTEYKERLHKTKKRMANGGLEVLIATHPANMNYLSSYDGWSFYTHQEKSEERQKFINFFPKNMKHSFKKCINAIEGLAIYLEKYFEKTKLLRANNISNKLVANQQ